MQSHTTGLYGLVDFRATREKNPTRAGESDLSKINWYSLCQFAGCCSALAFRRAKERLASYKRAVRREKATEIAYASTTIKRNRL